jgi:hypothetical protein
MDSPGRRVPADLQYFPFRLLFNLIADPADFPIGIEIDIFYSVPAQPVDPIVVSFIRGSSMERWKSAGYFDGFSRHSKTDLCLFYQFHFLCRLSRGELFEFFISEHSAYHLFLIQTGLPPAGNKN